MPDLNCFTLESAMKMVAGTARSMGITIKGEITRKQLIFNLRINMANLTKNRKLALEKVDTPSNILSEAADLVKEISITKFDASVILMFGWVLIPGKPTRWLGAWYASPWNR